MRTRRYQEEEWISRTDRMMKLWIVGVFPDGTEYKVLDRCVVITKRG